MTVYTEKNSVTLITGATDPDGDPITVRRIEGALITSWPYTVDLDSGRAIVSEDGSVSFDDEGTTGTHPTSGASQANGSFTFTLWDGLEESPTYTASITLSGANAPPVGQNQTLTFEV